MIDLPVVVVGAGPQGLAAAAHLLERGENALVLEAGDAAAAAVRQWAHVRLFSSWSELVDPAAARLLAAGGWTAPAEGYPSGGVIFLGIGPAFCSMKAAIFGAISALKREPLKTP